MVIYASRSIDQSAASAQGDVGDFLGELADGVFVCDSSCAITYMNAAAERMLDCKACDVLGLAWSAALPHVSGSQVELVCVHAMRERTTERVELYFEHYHRWFEVTASPVRNGGLIVHFRDISDRVVLDEALRRSERELRDFFDNGALPLHWVGPDGTILRANRAELQLLGYSAEEYVGRNITDFHADAHTISDILNCLTRGQTLNNREARLRCKDGSIKDVVITSSVFFDEENFVHTRCFTNDVTQLKQAERLLRKSEERVRLVHEAVGIGAWEWDIATNEIYWSPEYRAIYGLGADESPTFERGIAAVFEEDRAATAGHVSDALTRLGEYRSEHRVLRANNEMRWVFCIGKVFVDDEGKAARMIGVSLDITDRREAEEALRKADARKDQFLATLAHELRNPLAPMRNSLQLLRMPNLSVEAAETVKNILDRQMKHLIHLVDDLMEVSRISRGHVALRLEKADLTEIVARAVETSRPLIDAANHQLIIESSEQPVWVNADPMRLAQVLANILNNAAKYTDKGGRIVLKVARDEDHAVISVRDNGIGIESEMLPRIFDMFVQATPVVSRAQGGLGIGLSLAHSLVELHGGSIRAYSEGPGCGTEVVVRLPMMKSSEL